MRRWGAVQTDVTQDEIIVPPGVNTPTPAPTATPSPSPTSVLADFTSPIAYILDGNIWLIQPATGQQHKLIDFDSVPVWSPAWSSDGKQLAFGIAGSEMKGDIGILNLESGETRQLGLPDKSDDWHGSAIDLAWTADNSMIYYSMSTEPMGRYRRLRRVRSDGSGRVEIPSISRNWEWEGFPAFSPDGRWMTFGMMQKYYLLEWPADYWAIWGAQADESGSQQLVTGLSGQSSWSPDSTQMAYDTYWFKGNPGNNSIHLMDARGNHIRQLTSNGLAPSWAPNGQEVAFIRTTADGTAEVWIINVDGSNARKLTDGSEPAWRPILAGSSD
jgi:Tol biopolymer transport system component